METVSHSTQAFLDLLASIPAPENPDISLQRTQYESLIEYFGGNTSDKIHFQDCVLNTSLLGRTIRFRVYSSKTNYPKPIIIYFHGGGWIKGGIKTHDPLCSNLANISDSIVISVEYSLAPEAPFPAPLADGLLIYRWVLKNYKSINGDLGRICLAGDSAGGNIAAVLSQTLSKYSKIPAPALQLLLYPVLDLSCKSESYNLFSQGYLLTADSMKYYIQQYTPLCTDMNSPTLSPIKGEIAPNLAPALIFTAEFDPLRDEGYEYANILKMHGLLMEYKCFPGMIHAFLQLPKVILEATEALNAIGLSLKSYFWGERVPCQKYA